MPFLYFCWRNWHSSTKLLCVKFVIFREIQIHETSKSMTISAISNCTILIVMFIDNLLFNSFILWSIIFIACRSLSFLEIFLNFLSFISIKFGFLSLWFHLFCLFKLILWLSNLISMSFNKLIIFFHYFIHILIIYINKCYIFTFDKSLVFLI
jgi:hypothetical protein